jgi:hypothetical protein
MTAELPKPLVPSDVDLRGLEYMPLFGNHLLGSEFHAASDDTAWRAGVTLWWRAWNQVPAASLPNDDVALTRLADLGRDVKAWKAIKERALHGFVLCSDGRLYHAFLAKHAMTAWTQREKAREKKRVWRENRDRNRDGTGTGPGQTRGQEPGQEPGQDRDKGGDGTDEAKRSEVKGIENNPVKRSLQSSHIPADPNRVAALRSVLQADGRIAVDARAAMHLRQWAAEGVTDQQLADAVAIARDRKPHPEIIPVGYIAPIVPDVRAGVASSVPQSREQLFAEARRLADERERRDASRAQGDAHAA